MVDNHGIFRCYFSLLQQANITLATFGDVFAKLFQHADWP